MVDEAEALVEIRADDARPIYVQIVDEVRRAVVAGALEAEDPLPSVRELASSLQVNPNTVSRAYRELERDGLVYVRRGRGTFVSPDAVREEDRDRLAREVAERALREARRHSLSAEELIEAVRTVADSAEGGRTEGGDPGATVGPGDAVEAETREESR